MSKKRMNSAVANANGGIESVRALRHARNVLLNHDLKQPVLYHLVFMGSQSIPVYQAVIKSLIRRLRSRCRLEYFGAYENDEKKGMHAHLYILIETSKKTPFKLLDVNDGEYLHKLAERHGLVNAEGKTQRIHVSKPQNPMHDRQFFARPILGPLLDNCLDWIEYPFKRRSKDGIPAREKYFNSEFKANKTKRAAEMQQYYAPAAPAAPQLNESEQHETRTTEAPAIDSIGLPADREGTDSTSRESLVDAGQRISASEEGSGEANSTSTRAEHIVGIEDEADYQGAIEMTPAQKYVASMYEQAVDASLDVEGVRRFLLSNGILRTPGQVAWELEHEYGFIGYADSHPRQLEMEWQ